MIDLKKMPEKKVFPKLVNDPSDPWGNFHRSSQRIFDLQLHQALGVNVWRGHLLRHARLVGLLK